MLIVSGVFEIAPSDVPAARDAAEEMARATREEEGCFAYAFYEDIENEGTFRVFEGL